MILMCCFWHTNKRNVLVFFVGWGQKIVGGPRLHDGKQEEELTSQNEQLWLFSPLESHLETDFTK